MLPDASTSSAIRRPGRETSSRVKPGVRIGQRDGEQRQPGRTQQHRQVADRSQGRLAHPGNERRKDKRCPAGTPAPQQAQDEREAGGREQHDEDQQGRARGGELQLVPAGSQPLVGDGAERDQQGTGLIHVRSR